MPNENTPGLTPEEPVRPENLSFQVMPSGSRPMHEMRPMHDEPAQTELPVDHGHPFNNKTTYIIISILILAALGALAYFLLGNKTKTPDDTQNQSRLPKVWLQQHFNVEACSDTAVCGDTADPDKDGLENYDEFKVRQGTNPNDPDTDGDGLADGDEFHVYKTEPALKFSVCKNTPGLACEYDDGSQITNSYDPLTPGIKMTDTRKKQIADDTATYALHEPTPTTLSKAITTGKTVTVNVVNGKFVPATVSIAVNDTVVWVNKDTAKRMIASDPHPTHTGLPALQSNELTTNQTFSLKFTKAGSFGYHDHLNAANKGTVTVK